jgi:RNA polymerase sigma-70 factor (ECF subfamily)
LQTANPDSAWLTLSLDEQQKEQAFRLWMDAHQRRLYALIYRMLGAHADTDDVLQETFLKAWQGLEKFEGKSSLYTWLHRIAINETLRFLEKRKRQKAAEERQVAEAATATSSQAAALSGDEIERILTQAIRQLPPRQRMVFILRYFEAMDYQHMSDLLDTSVGSLKASYHHAAKKIEALIVNNKNNPHA